MNALLSMNNIAWKAGVHLFEDFGGLANKLRDRNRAEIKPDMLERSNSYIYNATTENNHIQNHPRQAKRVVITLPVVLDKSRCVTHDFSATGVYIVSETPHKNGERIEFIISVNQLLNKLILKCSGEVVRVGKMQGKAGFAVKISTHVLESEKDSDLNPLQQ